MTISAREARRRRKAELALRALVQTGNVKRACEELGIVQSTLHKQIGDYLTLNGYETVAQAAYWLDRERMSA